MTRSTQSGTQSGVRGRAQFGWPSPCPKCGTLGHLDYVDLVDHEMREHCPSCAHEWSVSEIECGLPPAPSVAADMGWQPPEPKFPRHRPQAFPRPRVD